MEIELGKEQIEVEDNIYDNQIGFSDKNQKKSLRADLAVSVVSSGGDLVQAIQDNATVSAEEMKTNATTAHQNKERQLLTDTVEFTAATNPEALPTVVGNASTRFSEIEAMGSSKLTPYLGWVNSLEGSEGLTVDQKKSIAVDSLLLEAITAGADERSWYQNGWDVLGMMAVPDESYNAAEIQAQLFGDQAGFTEWLGSREAYKSIASFRHSLSPEERIMFDERLVDVVKGVDDNVLQQIGSIVTILGRDSLSEQFQAMEKFDAVFIGSGLGKGLFKGLRSLNVLNRTARTGDARATAKIADVVTKTQQGAKEAGVPVIDAATVGNPVKPRGVFTGAPDGLQKEYRMYQGEVTAALEKSTDVLVITARPGTKDADEIVAAIKRNLSKNDDFENIEVKAGLEGVFISYDVISEGGKLTKEMRAFTLNDLGGFEQTDAGLIGSGLRFATSPNTLAGADRNFFVQSAEVALFAKSRISAGLTEAVDAALKPVNGNVKSLKKLDTVLKQLDGTDSSMSYHRLVNEGVGGQKLNDKEWLSITGLRRVLDDVWWQNNLTVRREMQLRGTKRIDVGDGDIQYAIPHADASKAYAGFSADVENQLILNSKDGTTTKGMGLPELETKYKEGQVLIKADSPNTQEWFASPEGFVRYQLVDKGAVKELTDMVLNKVKNYLPKLREDANYFIKHNREVVVNGTKRKQQVTVAYAATKSQALRYIERLKKTTIEAGEVWIEGNYVALFDREITKAARDADVLSTSGGLIRGKRKATELDWAGDIDEGGRTDALDSIQRYMGITADRVAMSEWRLEARTRVVNELTSVASIGDKVKGMDWRLLRPEIENASMDATRRAKLLGMYDQTSSMSNIPTKTDQMFQGAVHAVATRFDKRGKRGESIAKYLYQVQDKSVVDVMKGITFNLTLGMYNVVQVPVQLFGASVAVSINPVAATKALPRWLMASSLDLVTNAEVGKKFLQKVTKEHNIDPKEMMNDYQAWRKSGMYESVVRGSADASSLANRLPYDAGFIRRGWRRGVELGQQPYRIGELANMRISFFTALEREKGLKGKAFNYDDDAMIARVVSRAEQYRMNMSGANKAAFQKGIWALPTQFKQIYTKYMETMFGSHFTGKERASLFVGQAALFGAAGIPVINHFTDEFLTNIVGLESGDLTSEQLTATKRGALGWVINHELDIDALVSGRLTVSADVIEDLRRALTDERTPMFKTMVGASFTSGDKIYDFLGNSILAGGMIIDEYLDDTEGLHPKTKEAAYLMAESLLQIPGSTRKGLAALYLSQGLVRKADGTPLYSTNPELRDIIARSVGFGSQESDDLYKLSTADFKRKDKIRGLADLYIATLYRMDYGIREQLEGVVESSHINASVVMGMIDKEHPDDAREILDKVINRLSKPRDFREKTLHDSLINAVGAYTKAANEMSIIKQKFIEDEELGESR